MPQHKIEKRETETDRQTETDTDDLFIYAIAPHEGVQVDDVPPHSTCYNYAYNYAYEKENQQTNDDAVD